jgi:hypothetical protein
MSHPRGGLVTTVEADRPRIKHMFEKILRVSPMDARTRTSVRRTYVRRTMRRIAEVDAVLKSVQVLTSVKWRADMAITMGGVTIRPMPGAAARWRRIAVVVALLAAVAFVAPRAMASDSGAASVPADTWTVAQGETLWSIASAITAPGQDVRDTVAAIKGLNALDSSAIRAGEQLLIPALD